MSLLSALTLFAIMVGLAAMPSSSVLLVVTRSVTLNVRNGLATAAGVVAGDLTFVAMAVLGMTTLAEQLGTFFVVIKYMAAAYLIWMGITLLRSKRADADVTISHEQEEDQSRGMFSSFAAGLLLTLGDAKAIVFYASLLPAFMDLSALTQIDLFWVCAITVVAVGGTKAAYALAAQRVSRAAGGFSHAHELKLGVGGLMVGAGVYLALRD